MTQAAPSAAPVDFLDKLGALSIIDDLRLNERRVQDVLNLGAMRAKVSAKIREHYTAQGVQVSEDVVEEGVALYFARRYRFNPGAPQGALGRTLTHWYINWGPRWKQYQVLFYACVFLVSLYSAWFLAYDALRDSRRVALVEKTVAVATETVRDQRSLLDRLQASRYAHSSLEQAKANTRQIFDGLEHKLEVLKTESDEDASERLARGVRGAVTALKAQVVDIQDLAAADQIVDQWEQGASANGWSMDALRASRDEAVRQIEAGHGAQAKASAQTLHQRAEAAGKFSERLGQLDRLRAAAIASGLTGDDAERVHAAYQAAVKSAQAFDEKGFTHQSQILADLHTLATNALSIQVTTQKDEPTAVERIYRTSGGKSWYVIVDVVNVLGNRVPVIVESAETGEKRSVSHFGVRITHDKFQALRKDKADGVIDDRHIASKPVGELSFKYVSDVMPGIIFSW